MNVLVLAVGTRFTILYIANILVLVDVRDGQWIIEVRAQMYVHVSSVSVSTRCTRTWSKR